MKDRRCTGRCLCTWRAKPRAHEQCRRTQAHAGTCAHTVERAASPSFARCAPTPTRDSPSFCRATYEGRCADSGSDGYVACICRRGMHHNEQGGRRIWERPIQLLHVDQRPPVGGRLWCPRAPFGPLARDAPNMNGTFWVASLIPPCEAFLVDNHVACRLGICAHPERFAILLPPRFRANETLVGIWVRVGIGLLGLDVDRVHWLVRGQRRRRFKPGSSFL